MRCLLSPATARPSWGALGLATCLLVSGCVSRRIPPPPEPPTLETPAEAIPGDLDLVIRLDVAEMRGALGPDALARLQSRTEGVTGNEPEIARLVTDAIARADTAWFAFRPAPNGEPADNVLVLRGEFAGVDPAKHTTDPKWGIPKDLGGGWRRFDRDSPDARGAPARIYMRHDDLLVFVSEAEIDGVELVLERGAAIDRVRAPSEGTISVAVRAPTLARAIHHRSPAAAELLNRARILAAHADLGVTGLRGEVEIIFRDESTAQGAAEAARRLAAALQEAGEFERELVDHVVVSSVGTALVLRLAVDQQDLARLSKMLGA